MGENEILKQNPLGSPEEEGGPRRQSYALKLLQKRKDNFPSHQTGQKIPAADELETPQGIHAPKAPVDEILLKRPNVANAGQSNERFMKPLASS